MAIVDQEYNWSEENYDALMYFVENVSGPWHPSQWGVIIELCSQLKEWNGQKLPPTVVGKPRRSQLHISPLMQAFIQALTTAEYFEDVNEFYSFMHNAQSDKVFSLFRFWLRLDAPLEVSDEYWNDFVTEIFDYKENLQELDMKITAYSDEEIALALEDLKKAMEEE